MNDEMRPMTPEYSLLSLRAGFLAGMADAALGSSEFSIATRADKWKFDEAYINDLRARILARGVDPKLIEYADAEYHACVTSPDYLAAVERQAEIDKSLGIEVVE